MKVTLTPTTVGWMATVGTDGRHGSSQEEALGRLLLDLPDKLGVDLEKIPNGETFPVKHKAAVRIGFIVRDKKHGSWHGRPGRYDRWTDVDTDPEVKARACPEDYRKARIFASPTGAFGSLARYKAGIGNVWDDKQWALYELTDDGPVPFPTPERWAATYRKRAKMAVAGGLG